MECTQKENLKSCLCTYTSCGRRGKCCVCVRYHRSKKELPGCFFPADVEKEYDRSVKAFIKCNKK